MLIESLNTVIPWVAILAAFAAAVLFIYSFASRSRTEPNTGGMIFGGGGFIVAGLVFVMAGGVVTFTGV